MELYALINTKATQHNNIRKANAGYNADLDYESIDSLSFWMRLRRAMQKVIQMKTPIHKVILLARPMHHVCCNQRLRLSAILSIGNFKHCRFLDT